MSGDLIIKDSGKICIGTTNPYEKLDVNGNIYLTGKIIQEAWIPPVLQSGWENYRVTEGFSQAGYFLDKNGIVHLRGVVEMRRPEEIISSPITIFNLAQGYTPEFIESHAVISSSNSGFGRCNISPNGQVTAVAGSTGYFSLDGITFRAVPIDKKITEIKVITEGDNGKSINLRNGETFLLCFSGIKGDKWKLNTSEGLKILIENHPFHAGNMSFIDWVILALTPGNQKITAIINEETDSFFFTRRQSYLKCAFAFRFSFYLQYRSFGSYPYQNKCK